MDRVGVVGCGLMGAGIAEVCARAERDVVVVEAPDAVLASNTSSIPIMKIAVATSRPTHVLGVHFFNPVPVLSLVELVPSLLTDSQTTERTRAFVVNALLIPFVLSAIRMLESGFATAQDIDEGLVRKAVAESMYDEFKEPLYAPPPLLARMVDAGLVGRKTGRGFYTYQ
jgi:3-hydroxybutyryl-CoA dehydrogenase